jgi:hypothetical protein
MCTCLGQSSINARGEGAGVGVRVGALAVLVHLLHPVLDLDRDRVLRRRRLERDRFRLGHE